MGILFAFSLPALAALLAQYILPGVSIADFKTALLVAIVLGLLNLIVKPVLVILTLPVTIVTLGSFTNACYQRALIVMWAGSLVKGFKVDNFWWALLFQYRASVVSSVMLSLGLAREIKINYTSWVCKLPAAIAGVEIVYEIIRERRILTSRSVRSFPRPQDLPVSNTRVAPVLQCDHTVYQLHIGNLCEY